VVDYFTLARGMTREEWVAAYRFPFLLGIVERAQPSPPDEDSSFDDLGGEPTLRRRGRLLAPLDDATSLVRAVRKVKDALPDRITVGRTAHNDIQIDHEALSRYHAYFRGRAGGLELYDGGSLNGTYLRGRALVPDGAGVPVAPGDIIRFGHLQFVFLDAGGCWDSLHQR
jgi:hypothetical protein